MYITCAHLSTYPVYWYKIKKKIIIFGGYGHIRKWIQESIIIMRFCCCFKLSKKTEKLLNEQLADTGHRQMLTNWPSAIG